MPHTELIKEENDGMSTLTRAAFFFIYVHAPLHRDRYTGRYDSVYLPFEICFSCSIRV